MNAPTRWLTLPLLSTLFAAAPIDPVATFHRAVSVYTHETRGVLVYDRHIDFALKLGPTSREDRNDAIIILDDGLYARMRFRAMMRSGRPVGSADMEKEEQTANDDLRAGRGYFKEPYDPHFAEDYRVVGPADCVACSPDDVALKFESPLHDAQHGSGTLVIDEPTGHVLRETYRPYVLHDHATDESIVEVSQEVLPGLWGVALVEEHYTGRVAMFSGNAVLRSTRADYRRFPRLEAALAAVAPAGN